MPNDPRDRAPIPVTDPTAEKLLGESREIIGSGLSRGIPLAGKTADQAREIVYRSYLGGIGAWGQQDKLLGAAAGEYRARKWIAEEYLPTRYGGAAADIKGLGEVDVPRRGKGPRVLDLLFELPDEKFVVVEAKFHTAKLAKNQFTARWLRDRIVEIHRQDAGLADRLWNAWRDDRITGIHFTAPFSADVELFEKSVKDATADWRKYMRRLVAQGKDSPPWVKAVTPKKGPKKPRTGAQKTAKEPQATKRQREAKKRAAKKQKAAEARAAEKKKKADARAAAKQKAAGARAEKQRKTAQARAEKAKAAQVRAEQRQRAAAEREARKVQREAAARARRSGRGTAKATESGVAKAERAVHGGRATDVERGIAAAERGAVAEVATLGKVEKARKASTAGHVVTRSAALGSAVSDANRGLKARSLVVGVKAWRVARRVVTTVGRVLVVCFVPLTVLDFLAELAFGLLERELEREGRAERHKQKAVEALFADDVGLQQKIDRALVQDSDVQERFFRQWDAGKSGFLYARVEADLDAVAFLDSSGEEIEALTTCKVAKILKIEPTSSEFDFALVHGDYRRLDVSDADLMEAFQKGAVLLGASKWHVRVRVGYTVLPPLFTPFDILITKMNNLFLDVQVLIAEFSGIIARYTPFSFGLSYDEIRQRLIFPKPLDGLACERCLSYLYWAAKRLAQHPLLEVDLEGNLEKPVKGWERRVLLFYPIWDGRDAPGHDDFRAVGDAIRLLVPPGKKTNEVFEAMELLAEGADAIWTDIERVASEYAKREYYYVGKR